MKFKRLGVVLFAVAAFSAGSAFAQTATDAPRTVTLVKRVKTPEADNYTQAAFSFKYGANGADGLKLTRNNWDILFGNSTVPDAFDVTTVTDDRSRIADLGAVDWSAGELEVPRLEAYEKPTREKSVAAVVGHMYLVHAKDTETDHYAIFRVEKLVPGESVTISWKLLTDNKPVK